MKILFIILLYSVVLFCIYASFWLYDRLRLYFVYFRKTESFSFCEYFKLEFFILGEDIREFFRKYFGLWRYKIWKQRNYIPENEFDRSLDMNMEAMVYLSNKARTKYFKNLAMRRKLAHERDLERMDNNE